MFTKIILSLGIGLSFFSWAEASPPVLAEKIKYYYGDIDRATSGEELKNQLHHVLDSFHISKNSDFDELTQNCSSQNPRCYVHRNLGYNSARKYLFGYLHLQQGSNGYYVISSYCQDQVSNDEFPSGAQLGPMKIPSPNVLNTEHSWPQSHFTGSFSKSMQKSDLHALYPTRMQVNSTRGNYPYGKVVDVQNQACGVAALGRDDQGQTVFEPSDEIKGNIARAIFYFSTRYKVKIDATQEHHLRLWHQLDPIDSEEQLRNDEIYEIQYVRNPYIDHPEWVDQISDF